MCSASSKVAAALSTLRAVSAIRSERPTRDGERQGELVREAAPRRRFGRQLEDGAQAAVRSRVTAAIAQARMRAKPCSGASGAPAFGPNHGKQIGTPPRIGLPASKRLSPLIHSTGLSPLGWKWVTCAPWR